jgi:hypothetical protein
VVGPGALRFFLDDFSDSLVPTHRARFQNSFTFLDCDALRRDKEFAAPALSDLKRLADLEAGALFLFSLPLLC